MTREACVHVLNGESQISLIIIKERGKAWGVGGSNFYQIPHLISKM